MPLTLPNLDDRSYTDLVEEARAMIPTYAPEWTNHNPSDPGVMLIELFAYLSEMLIYQLNRVTDDNTYAFLKLLEGPEWKPSAQKTLSEEIRDVVSELRQPNRAITCADFENLALAADPTVERARCVPRRNLESENPLAHKVDRPGHISLVIVPDSEESNPQPSDELKQAVKEYLEPRRLLTTRMHVVGPRYCTVGVRLTLFLKPDAEKDKVRPQVIQALQEFLHPLPPGGPGGKGWPFGRDVYVSEIYELLDTQPGVDYVEKTKGPDDELLDELTVDDPSRLKRNALGGLVAVEIQPDELVDAQIDEHAITIVSPLGEREPGQS